MVLVTARTGGHLEMYGLQGGDEVHWISDSQTPILSQRIRFSSCGKCRDGPTTLAKGNPYAGACFHASLDDCVYAIDPGLSSWPSRKSMGLSTGDRWRLSLRRMRVYIIAE